MGRLLGKKLAPSEAELYRRVDEVLHYVWDPIGVSDAPAARDEYQNYLPRVFSMVNQGSDTRDIAEYLDSVVTGNMGLEADRGVSRRVAELLIEHRRWIAER